MPAYYTRAAIRSQYGAAGALVVNTLHYEIDTLTSPIDMSSAAADIWSHLSAAYRAMMDTNLVVLDLTLTVETYPGSTPAQGIALINLPGTRTVSDTSVSVGLCGVMSLKSATPKRYARGHIFLPPVVGSTQLGTGGGFGTGSPYYVAAKALEPVVQNAFTVSSTTYAPIIFSRTRVRLNQTPFQFPVVQARFTAKQTFLRSRLTSP